MNLQRKTIKKSTNPYISVVIPTLNEERNIRKAIDGIKTALNGFSFEIIVVDKYSKDKTTKYAKAKGARLIYTGGGKGYALRRGFEAAKGKIIISMDADLSNKPGEIKLIVVGIETGYDICMGSRFIIGGGSEDMSLLRKFGNKFFVGMVNLIYHSNYSDMCYGYRGFRKSVIKKLKLKSDGFGIETEINIRAKKVGLRILEVPSFEKMRGYGRSNLRTFRDGYMILKTIFSNIRR